MCRLWQNYTEGVIVEYQEAVIGFVREGYDERTVGDEDLDKLNNLNYYQVAERWSFPSALMFTLSVITMIGYVFVK